VSSDRTNTTTERKCTPNQVESSLSILCVPSKRITEVFIGDVSPSECKYYSKPLQWSYSQNIRGLTCNFPITTVSGLQLRRAAPPGATHFATINLDAFSEDSLSFDRRLRHRVDAPIQPFRRIIRRPSCSSLDLCFSPRRYSLFGASTEDPHVLRLTFASARTSLGLRVLFGIQAEGGVPKKGPCQKRLQTLLEMPVNGEPSWPASSLPVSVFCRRKDGHLSLGLQLLVHEHMHRLAIAMFGQMNYR